VGWRQRLPLRQVIFRNRWGGRPRPRRGSTGDAGQDARTALVSVTE